MTSTIRSVAHNRAVGGVRNSWHLSGRAIDIARRPGVTHAQIAAAFRNAGYYLIESLDEGDHSHFAFGGSGGRCRGPGGPAGQLVGLDPVEDRHSRQRRVPLGATQASSLRTRR